MNQYLNFTVIGEDGRFHVLLPWQNAHAVGFNAIDTHLQTIVPEAVFDRTRQLKVSEYQPEADSRDFHVWQRQQKLQSLGESEQQLHKLIGGVVQKPRLIRTGNPISSLPNSTRSKCSTSWQTQNWHPIRSVI